VSVTATDDGGNTSPAASQTVTVSATPQLQNGVLAVPGTPGKDAFTLTPVLPTGATAYSMKISRTTGGTTVNFGTFAVPGGGIQVYGGPGSDTVTLNGTPVNDAFTVGSGTVGVQLAQGTTQTTGFTVGLNGAAVALSGGGTGSLTGPSQPSTWVLTGGGRGTLNDPVSFTGFKTLIGASGNDTIQGPNATNAWSLTGADSGTVVGTAFQSFQHLIGGTGNDTFTVAPGVGFNGGVAGGGGTDTLVGQSASGAASTWQLSGANAGTVQNAAGTVTFTGITNLTGGAGNDDFRVLSGGSLSGKVTGGGGTDTLDYSQYGAPVTVNLPTLSGTGVGSFAGIKNLLGGSAANTLQGPNATNAWQISGPGRGTVAGYSFSSFQNLIGGTGNDTFTVAAGAAFSGSMNGGGGTDTLVGASAASASSTWLVTGANAGTFQTGAGTVSFVGIANLTGGAGSDAFQIGVSGSLSGKIGGGGGSDWLDYSAWTAPVTVDLTKGTATAVTGGVSAILNVRGGAGNDTLTGGGGNILVGGGGNNTLVDAYTGAAAGKRTLLIAGAGGSTLQAGGGGDILIGGTPLYDNHNTARAAILAEWQSGASYNTRFSCLAGLQSGGLNGAYDLIWGNTVLDNGASDTLVGSATGLDWFFAQLSGVNLDTILNLNKPGHEHVDNTL
jgi:hypothetical protein